MAEFVDSNSKFVISLDFEKYWGIRDHSEISEYQENLENVDQVIINLLDIFDKYDIHATWGIVGFLLHKNKKELINKLPQRTDFYDAVELNPYPYLKNNDLDSQFHFAEDIINKISRDSNQEIASHTYSHYYALEEGQNIKDFEDDLKTFLSVSNEKGYDVTSIIFPRNQINENYISVLTKHGISAYRGNEQHHIYKAEAEENSSLIKRGLRLADRYLNITGYHTYPLSKKAKFYNIKSSRFLAPYISKLRVLEFLRLRRIKNAMTYAAKNNQIYHLWWHPHNFGKNMEENFNFLDEILKHYNHLNQTYGMKSMNMQEVVKESNNLENSNVSK